MDDVERNASESRTGQLSVGGHVVDPRANTVTGPAGSQSVEPKVMDVLLELCDQKGQVVSREALIDAVWGVHHGADESLTRAISLLRKALEAGPQGRRAIETFSKRGYRLNLEVTRAGEASAGEGAQGAQGAKARGSAGVPAGTWAMGAGVAAVAAIGLWMLFGGGYRDNAGEAVAAPASMARVGLFAVEPWSSRSGLSEISQTGPRALASAFAQRGIPSALVGDVQAARPEAEFRVTGDVRKRGESMVVGIAITESANGAVIWADEQVRSDSDGLSLVEGAVAHAANVAECALSARRQYQGGMSTDVLSAWMRHCHGVWLDDYALTYETAERLVALTPDEATAQAALAKAAYGYSRSMDHGDAELWRQRALAAAERARAIDQGNVDGLFVLAALESFGQWDDVQRAFETVDAGATTSQGSDEALLYYLLRTAGYLDDAETHASFRSARSPGPIHLTEEAWLMSTAGMSTRAVEQLDEVIRLYPDYMGAYWRRFNILALHGDLQDAEIALAQAQSGLYPGKDAELSCWEQYLLARLGRIEAEGALTDEVCTDMMQEFRARLHGALGQVDQALEYSRLGLDEAEATDHRAGTIHLFYPEMAEMRRDPRFWEQADRVGLVDFWISYGRWPDFCSDRRVVVDCPAMADAVIAARG